MQGKCYKILHFLNHTKGFSGCKEANAEGLTLMAGRYQQPNNEGMKKLQTEIAQGISHRIYLFFGEERYLVLQYRDRMKKAIVSDGDEINLNIHKEASPELSKVMDECLSMPFFAEKRLVILQDSGYFATPSASQDALAGFLDSVPETTVLLFVESQVDKRNKLYKAVARTGMAVEFQYPDEQLIRSWVGQTFRRHNVRIPAKAIDLLLDRAGVNMSMLDSQMDKLISCAGEGGTLSREDVDNLVTERLETKVFAVMNAVGLRQRKEAIDRYDEMIRMKERPEMILPFLTRGFNMLYQTKCLLAEKKSNVQIKQIMQIKYDFQLRNYISQQSHFTLDQLRSAVEDCADLEQKYKSGRINVSYAIETLLIKYSR